MKLMKLCLSGKRRVHDVWFPQRWRFATSPVSKLTVLFYMVRLERVSVVHKRLRSVPDIPRKETLNVVCLLLYTLSNISDTLHVHICQLLVIVP